MKKTTLLLVLLLISLSISAQTYLSENFDTNIPATWTVDDAGAATGDSWISGQVGGVNNLDGTNAAFVDSDANGNGTLLIETLTSPTFDTTGATAIFLDFDQYYRNIGADTAVVEVWDGTAWVPVLTQTTTAGAFSNPDQQHIDLTAYSNNAMQIRFVYDDADSWAWYWLVDNVIVYNATCPNPDSFTFLSATSTTADISWTAGGTETAWEVAIQTPGTGMPTGSGTATTSNNPYVATGLTPATNYEAYVRADCGGDFSIWVGPINFATECTTFVAPYTEGFENGGDIPLCWTMDGGEDWQFDNDPGFNHIGDNGTITGTTATNDYFAWVDSSGDDGPTTLTTPLVDVSTLATPALSFYELSDNEDNDNSQLDVEVWDGAAWNLMATYNTNTNGWEEKTINLSTLTITGDVQARFIFSETSTGFYDDIAIDDVTFDELPSCVNPGNLAVDSATDTTATLSWMVNGTETAWEVAVQAPGTGIPTGAGMAATTNPYTATGLTAATTYEYYVRANCGTEFSDWIGPLVFDTECAVFIAPYTEGFENGGIIPLCWTMDGGEDWEFANDPGFDHIGNNGVITGTTATNDYFAWVDSSGTDAPATLTTPLIDVSGLAVPALSFYELSDNEGNDNSQLDVEVWDGAAWNLMATYNTNTNGWEEKTINLSTLTITGNVQARFIFSEVITPGDFYDDIAIDDVTFDELPSCVNPANLGVDSTTDTTATLSWMVNGTETAWEVVVQSPGTGMPTGAGDPAATNPYTATGLTAITDYEYFVRADCGNGDFSDWVGPFTFTTECSTFAAPYTEGFENGGTIPDCWTMNGGGIWEFANDPGFDHIGNNGTITGNTATNDYFAWVDSSGDNGPTSLFSPLIDTTPLAEPALSFYLLSDNEGNANSQLDVEVWDGAAWNPVGTYNTNTGGWEYIIINISTLNITGPVQVQFIFSEVIDPSDFYDDIAIDDVTIDELPPCLFPNTITTSNTTETSVDISWIPGASETAWEYVVQPVGTGTPTTNGTPATNTTVTETMLSPGTAYEIYVRSDCNSTGDGFSDWTGPVIFYTLPENDDCEGAINFLANADGNCTNFTSGSLSGATQSPQANPCSGTPNDDVWFSFTAVSTDHAISLSNIVGSTTFLSHGLYEGPDCNNLTNLTCSTADNSTANGLTIGNTYYIRVFSNGSTPATTTFDLCVFSIPPPITTDITQYTVPELVEDILVNSPCSTISNVTSSTGTNFGSDNGIGYFEANGSGFPFESGIIMTTGNAVNAPGPETGTLSDGGGAGWPGDPDLEAEIMEGPTNNASIIEFDFVPFIEDMSFEFIFAAEEYGTFQCGFSDAFAFLLTDTVTGVTTNIAVIPGTTTPVSVFTIRDMAFNGSCPSSNAALFDAYYGPGGQPALTNPTNFIGRTVPLTASSTVVPNRTYHIKLVIADDGDTAYDSAVFLKAGSFEIGEVDLGEDILLSSGNANCEGDEVILDIGVPVGDNATITWYTINDNIQEAILDENGAPESGTTLAVTETNNYIVEIVLNANASCFVIDDILVEFFPNPVLPDNLPDILGCDVDNTNQAIFDLTENENLITGTQTGLIITYYLTEQDAIDQTNAITNTTTYSSTPTTIYYNAADGTTSCDAVGSFNIALAPKPQLAQADNILGCDDDEDGISNYDLTSNETVIANGNTGLTFSYHNNLADAEASTNAIAVPTDYDGGTQTIYVRAESNDGCFETATFDLDFGISPSISFDTDVLYEVCPNATSPISVTAIGDNFVESDVTITWYNEGVLVPGQTSLTINNVLTSGTYTIEVMFNQSGCTSSESIFVDELETCVIPQGISPDGDGLNDNFDLSSFDVQSLQIFNRNGRMVYEKTNYKDEWHGQSLDGDELPVGTYYYVMNYQGNKTKAAWVYINRAN
ncbi:choice-of-anchor L domain-containing protein [Lacinutrix sp. 5H-3-7-4]|uniref:choice-of-anchor L domain-containing protein n=1 Tax=Lacinutrix sp. (strain 5H-3-7-4) TaxID=983544 RepID=UPI00020A35B4|nr:choice-of-anchor L domain-containing protein [Lacinutrix sp. 5H-3-7-4]AEH00763.1 Fibronectin type III domain protein [Lacinutrix sp. 5H-3-7-4]